MNRLLIMRHAKSDWGAGVASDRERPLAPRGVKAARRMGKTLARIGEAPDLVLSSPAVRARTTAELAASAGDWSAEIEIVPTFYGGQWSDVVEGVVGASPNGSRVMVVGHEPTWSELVSVLAGGGRVAMPTGAVACLELNGSLWSSLTPGGAELQWLLTPRMLKPLL